MKRQLKTGKGEQPSSFDRKVLHYGFSRTLAMGRIIPEDWEYVRLTKIAENSQSVTVKITRLVNRP